MYIDINNQFYFDEVNFPQKRTYFSCECISTNWVFLSFLCTEFDGISVVMPLSAFKYIINRMKVFDERIFQYKGIRRFKELKYAIIFSLANRNLGNVKFKQIKKY